LTFSSCGIKYNIVKEAKSDGREEKKLSSSKKSSPDSIVEK